MKLYKTTIEIWTDHPTSDIELVDLAQAATEGYAFCGQQFCDFYCSPFFEHPDYPDNPGYDVPDAVLSFFGITDENNEVDDYLKVL